MFQHFSENYRVLLDTVGAWILLKSAPLVGYGLFIATLFMWQRTSGGEATLDWALRSLVKLATLVEGEPKAPFSIATTPRCWRALLLSLDCSTLPLQCTLYCWVLARRYQVPFLKPLVRCDLGLNPGLSDHWWTLYPLGQWTGLLGQLRWHIFLKGVKSHLWP